MMKENKSPGVDGIPPKLLKEIVDQISTPLAVFFNVSLKERIFIMLCMTIIHIQFYKK